MTRSQAQNTRQGKTNESRLGIHQSESSYHVKTFRSFWKAIFGILISSPSRLRKQNKKNTIKDNDRKRSAITVIQQATESKRMRRNDGVTCRTRVAAAFAPTIFVFFVFLILIAEASNNSQIGCSRKCVADNCNSVGIRYGKYCGVGWTGCPGEKPCDDLDACCKDHDECVEKKGMTNIKCHEKFKKCIKKVHKSGKVGFSRDCPYDTAVPTMVQGMDMAILFSQLGNSKLEL